MDRAARAEQTVCMTTTETTTAPTLPATLRLGATHLAVSSLDGSIAFYERTLGLRVHRRDAGSAALGAGGEDLLVLVEQPGAGPGGPHPRP
jgi:catechol 2,3-dioxygenase